MVPQETPDHMLEQAHGLLVDELGDHVGKHSADSVEAFVRLADVLQTHVVQENLLYNEDGDGLAELGTGLHDTEAQRDDLSGEEEVDDLGAVVLDESANDTERSQTEIFEGATLGGGVEEGVEKEGNMC